MHSRRAEVRFPKILRGMFCPVDHVFNDLTTIVTLPLGHRRIEIRSRATLGSDELRLLLGLLAMAMGDESNVIVEANVSKERLDWLEGEGITPRSVRWIGSRYRLLNQSAFGKTRADYNRINKAVDRLMGVTIELHTDHHVEKFALIEYARIGKTAADSTVELQINPLLSTVLTADLKISDPKLFGYFRLFFKDIQKIPRTGFCLNVYLILQCRLLEIQHKRPVEYTLDELRNLLQFDLVRSAVVKKRQVSVGSFNRQIRVALGTVCKTMDWTFNYSSNRYVVEPAPTDWFSRAGFFSRNDALFFGCNSTNYCLFDRGVDTSGSAIRDKFWAYLKWLVECNDAPRLQHARSLFATANEGFKAVIIKHAGRGNPVSIQLTTTS